MDKAGRPHRRPLPLGTFGRRLASECLLDLLRADACTRDIRGNLYNLLPTDAHSSLCSKRHNRPGNSSLPMSNRPRGPDNSCWLDANIRKKIRGLGEEKGSFPTWRQSNGWKREGNT